MPTTRPSAAAVKTSGVRLVATQRRPWRSSNRPPSTMAAITPSALPASIHGLPAAAWPVPSSGSSARIGIAATSWNSRIEKPAWPLAVGSRLRSPITCKATAVDDSASPSAPTTAQRHGAPASIATPASAAAQASTCTLPQPKIGRRMAQSRRGSSSSPTRNSISTTPNSATCSVVSGSLMRPRPAGPMAMPAHR